jgi:ribonuclease HII
MAHELIVGVDENNFSPSIAGDCIVTALAAKEKVEGVKDSKILTHKQRLHLFSELQKHSQYIVVPASVNLISEVGIYEARNLGIILALQGMQRVLDKEVHVIIDGPFSKKWMDKFNAAVPGWSIECLVDGDTKIYEVSAASIIGRVYADALFAGFGQFYPGYGFEIDHGAPSKKHYEALRRMGPSPFHRWRGYAPEWWKSIQGGMNEKDGKGGALRKGDRGAAPASEPAEAQAAEGATK